jgi:TolA-binding protein
MIQGKSKSEEMSENTRQLAERIAALLQESEQYDAAFLRQSLEKINQRLDRIESQLTTKNPQSAIQTPQSLHPSLEKFDVAEIIADRIIGGLENEKACPYEPTGKPCDHCSMCNSRGF